MSISSKFSVRKLALLGALTAMISMTPGCYIGMELDPGDVWGDGLSDLEVDWKVNNSKSHLQCGMYGIETWRVRLTGPVNREMELRCRPDAWWTADVFYGLPGGDYEVIIEALDLGREVRAGQVLPVHVDGFDHLDVLFVDFLPHDFAR